jgi:RNA polymerase-binding transcription factor DksA
VRRDLSTGVPPLFTWGGPLGRGSVAGVADTDSNTDSNTRSNEPALVHEVPDAAHQPPRPPVADGNLVDLDAIERDLAGVERALERLSDGTYWTDEVTGEPIPEHVLAADPTVRRA